jgi:hypothetical protein
MYSSEENPLLEGDRMHIPDELDSVYRRFSKTQKNVIIFTVSFAGLLPSAYKSTIRPPTALTLSRDSVRDWDLRPFHSSDSS